MVRARAVEHPAKWKWSGYDELVGDRKRYRIINRPCLATRLGCEDGVEFSNWFRRTMDEKVNGYHVREPWWTESLAVGDPDWIERIAGGIVSKTKNINPVKTRYDDYLGESTASYFIKTSLRERAAFTRDQFD